MTAAPANCFNLIFDVLNVKIGCHVLAELPEVG